MVAVAAGERRARANLWRGRLAIGALALALCALQVAAFSHVRQDDPFITYRYAQNLAEGRGLVFNPGERFLGAASPLHMLLGGLVYSVAGRDDTPSAMAALGCAAWSVQALAVYALLAPAFGALGGLGVALLIDLGAARSFMWVPFETNLLGAFALLALCAVERRRWSLAALCAGLACLARPDALVLAGLVLGACVFEQRARAFRPAALFVAVVAPWVVFASAYYGNPLPHGVVEQLQRTPLPQYLEHALLHVSETVLPFVVQKAWAVPGWALVIGGAFALARRGRAPLLLVLYGLLHWLAYVLLRPFSGHDWQLYPAALCAALCAASGLLRLAQVARFRSVRVAAGLALVALATLIGARTGVGARDYARGHWTGARDTVYRRIAGFLELRAHRGEEFAAVEVGTLAYYTGMSAFDLGGVITDLKHTQLVDRPVRFLVLDTKYLANAPPWGPLFSAVEGDFKAFVYYLPPLPPDAK